MKIKSLPLHRRATAAVMVFSFTFAALGNPTGMTVGSGTATTSVNGSQLTVNAGNNAVLNWQSFNIAAGEKTIFNQPSATSIVFNRISGQSASQIYGSLQANGVVVLLNSSGFYFGPNSFVSAAGLVVSTANFQPPQNGGGAWQFNGPPPLASIVNYGHITIGHGGDCYLIANHIDNEGTIAAPGGNIGLAAGQTVLLSERVDGRGMSMNVTLPQGSVDNKGNLIADAGTISLNAKVVNQDGFIQANSVQNQNGVIELTASDALNLGANSQILANGDDSIGGSAGGNVTLTSGNIFSDAAGSTVEITGGANGGNGGAVEISAPVMPALNTMVDGHAQAGSTGGNLLLDPDYIVLDQSGNDATGAGGTVLAGSNPGGTLHLNVNGSAFIGLSQITLQANDDITLADGTAWNLSGSTGQSGGQLTLEAGRNIIFGNSTALYDANNWSIALYAGVTDFSLRTVAPGAGSIYLNAFDPNNPNNNIFDPSGYIKTATGSITMVAGQDITVGTGYVNTTGGGSINAHALAGSIDTGGYAQGYFYQAGDSASEGYYVDPTGVSGISTVGGGDVNLTAGGDITSIMPTKNGYIYDGNTIVGNNVTFDISATATAGAGAYGPGQAGNVNIIAGGNVTGHYVVADGTGSIFAGVQMDAAGNPITTSPGKYVLGATGSAGTSQSSPNLSLSLIAGGWNVAAAQNIYLQEVNNPNGDFNTSAGGAFHTFDYAPADFVNLAAGNQVQLGSASTSLPRLDTLKVPFIYPGILNIVAGAGGVVLTGDSTYNQLILFPSPLGSLTINTTDGGSLIGSLPTISGTPQIFSLIVSDSSRQQYNSSTGGFFGLNDHASTPIHLNSATPIELNVSGDMDSVLLGVPEAAQINVVGDMNNSRFQGINLQPNDITSITVGTDAKANMEASGILNAATDGGLVVGGEINNRGAFTSIDLSQVVGAGIPDLSALINAVTPPGSPSATTLASSFSYNPTTKILTYQNISGVTLASVLSLLQNLTVQIVQNGIPQWLDSPFDTVPKTTTVSVLDAATAQALQTTFNTLGSPVAAGTGYVIGGGGQFDITAKDLDLGTTIGIQSIGVGLYKVGSSYPLAHYFTKGSDININLTGDLTMYSTSIASLNSGNISVYTGGSVNVGSSDFSVAALGARGIYTTSQGDISVLAAGDIDVNGSRIATYNGGNITVESLNGNINAGSGGASAVVVSSFSVNPVTHAVTADSSTIPGSGILATTFFDDPSQGVGSVLVETPNGDVTANSGGIIQLPFNDTSSSQAMVEVLAGYELRDASGLNRLTAADLAADQKVAATDDLTAPYNQVDGTGNIIGKLILGAIIGNIDANGSGLMAENAIVLASGIASGHFISKNGINIVAGQGLGPTFVLGKDVSVTAPTTTGPIQIVGTDHATTSGNIDPSDIQSANANGGGISFAQGTAANATSQAASTQDTSKLTKQSDTDDTGDLGKKKKEITLAQKVSRVTVLLPAKQ